VTKTAVSGVIVNNRFLSGDFAQMVVPGGACALDLCRRSTDAGVADFNQIVRVGHNGIRKKARGASEIKGCRVEILPARADITATVSHYEICGILQDSRRPEIETPGVWIFKLGLGDGRRSSARKRV